ncbi:MAG: serine hydrolase, partial [Firmicutes bacterium]|nr:serine hydrolase [Bacillota bacterium]
MKVLYTDYTDEAKLKELAEKHSVPGFNYCLIKNGVAGVTRAYGVQNVETGLPYEPSTIIEEASLTKTLFACLVM